MGRETDCISHSFWTVVLGLTKPWITTPFSSYLAKEICERVFCHHAWKLKKEAAPSTTGTHVIYVFWQAFVIAQPFCQLWQSLRMTLGQYCVQAHLQFHDLSMPYLIKNGPLLKCVHTVPSFWWVRHSSSSFPSADYAKLTPPPPPFLASPSQPKHGGGGGGGGAEC